ncbi:sulfur carrier protein ThiS [Shewanella algicola]|uniref:sulfur carrier protein ThiS n=1 Tax=Shewanella algicola TaxID=640633 RepID=UPI002494A5D8|nr:sulfur carrier protein ThiS [Shewanella algicola]
MSLINATPSITVTTDLIRLELNGTTVMLEPDLSLSGLLVVNNIDVASVAIVVNDTVIPRSGWQHIQCQANDRINVFSAVAGG